MLIKKSFSIILYLPWLIILASIPLILYWSFQETPLHITYSHHSFISTPASNKEEADRFSIKEIAGGSVVYRYLEYCVDYPFTAHVQRAWVGSAIVWPAPDTITSKSLEVGCKANSFALEVPTSSPTRTFSYTQRMYINVNPIRTDIVEYLPIPLTILSPADTAAKAAKK